MSRSLLLVAYPYFRLPEYLQRPTPHHHLFRPCVFIPWIARSIAHFRFTQITGRRTNFKFTPAVYWRKRSYRLPKLIGRVTGSSTLDTIYTCIARSSAKGSTARIESRELCLGLQRQSLVLLTSENFACGYWHIIFTWSTYTSIQRDWHAWLR